MSDRRCAICGGELPADARVDAQFCSGKCRQQALRDRGKSDAVAVIGGVRAPIASLEASGAAFGVPGAASIRCQLRGEPARSAGRIPVQIAVEGETIWRGDLERLTRTDSGVTITAISAATVADDHTAAQRVLTVEGLAVTTYGSWSAAPVAVAVRGVRDHIVYRVGAGDIGALATLTTKVQRTFAAVEDFADRLAGKLASEIMLAEATVTDRTVVPGARVRLEHDTVRDLEFTVTRVTYAFSGAVLTTNITALHVPSKPISLERGGFATIPTIGPLASVQPARAAPGVISFHRPRH